MDKKRIDEIKQAEIEKQNVGDNKDVIKNSSEHYEDVTQYGEFVTSYFAWLPPEKQKKKSKRNRWYDKEVERIQDMASRQLNGA